MTEQYKYLTDTGAIVADTSDVLASVQQEFKNALGENLNVAASTRQGTLIAAETLARTGVMKYNAELANVINPNLSYGTFLDAVCSLLGISRGDNKSTIATGVVVTGTSTTVISAGSRVSTSNNDIFTLAYDVTIPPSGTTTAIIQSAAYGPIPLPTGDLVILDGTVGWGGISVDSGAAIVLGTLSLDDSSLKNKRKQQLSIQGVGSSAAVQAAILSVPNVTSVQVVENNTGATGLVNGVTFTKTRAVWVCVDGTPTQSAIAQALYDAHFAGCPYDFGATGNGTPVNAPDGTEAVDPATGLKYYVKWTTPIKYDCYVNITVHQSSSTTSPAPAVQNAIVSYANGQEEGEAGLIVGADVSSFEMAGAVARQLPGLYIKACSVAVVPQGSLPPAYPAAFSSEVIISQFARAYIQTNNVTVNIV